jgi:hypothetical protein
MHRSREPWPGLFTYDIVGTTLRNEDNAPVPWSVLQTQFLEQRLAKMRARIQGPKTLLTMFESLSSLLRAHPSIDTVWLFFFRA